MEAEDKALPFIKLSPVFSWTFHFQHISFSKRCIMNGWMIHAYDTEMENVAWRWWKKNILRSKS